MNEKIELPIAFCPDCGKDILLFQETHSSNVVVYSQVGFGELIYAGEVLRGRYVVNQFSLNTLQDDYTHRTFLRCTAMCGFQQVIHDGQLIIYNGVIHGFESYDIPVQESLFHGQGEHGAWMEDSDLR